MVPPAAVAETRAYLRVDGAGEDALVAQLLRGACTVCEGFTGQAVIAREIVQTVRVTGGWQRLGRTPVRGVLAVADAAGIALPVDAYAIDIDASGDGWVRVDGLRAGRVTVTFRVGIAEDWDGVPDALRHGIVRLAAHLYTRSEDAAPPAAVTALWRPFRRMRLR